MSTKNTETLARDYTVGSPMKQLLVFSLPFMASNLLQQAYSMADTVIVGRYLGSTGLTAAGNASNIIIMFLLLCIGFSSAGQIIISQHMGAGNKDHIKVTIGTMLTLEFILGIIFMALPFLLAEPLLRLINIPEEAFDGAMDYVRVCAVGNFTMALYNGFSSILRGMGDSKHPMIFVIISSVLNVFLDILFVGPWGMGCFGAALATVISQTISCICCIVFVYSRRKDIGFDFKLKSFRMDKKETAVLFRLGVPLMVQNFAITISFMYINAHVNTYGVTAAAVSTVGSKISMVASICCGALNMAGSTIVGQNFGAGKHSRVAKTLGCILLIGCAFAALLAILVAAMPEQIFGLFDSDPDVKVLCHTYVIISVIDVFGYATRSAAFAFINGIGFSGLAFVGGLMDGFICRIGFALIFEQLLGMGLQGLWLGSVLAGHVFFFIGGAYFLTGRWKNRRTLVEQVQ